MAKRIYIGNLPHEADESGIRELFSPHGEVGDVRLIADKNTGLSKGFAFVEMPDDAAAEQAIQQLNGFDMAGSALVVNEARPRRTDAVAVSA